MEPLEAAAIATFTKCLPADILRAVDLQQLHTLEKAYATASFMENSMDSNIIPDTRYKTYQSNPSAWERHECTAASYSPQQPCENCSYRQEYNSYDNPAHRDVSHVVTHSRILQRLRQKDNQAFQPRRGYQDPGRLFQLDSKLFNPYDSRNDDTPAPRNTGYHRGERQEYRNFQPANRAPQGYNNSNYNYSRPNVTPRPTTSGCNPRQNISNPSTLNSNATRSPVPCSSQWQQRDQSQKNQHPLYTSAPSLQSQTLILTMQKRPDCSDSTVKPVTIRDLY